MIKVSIKNLLIAVIYSSFGFRVLILVDLCCGKIGLLNILILATWCLINHTVKPYPRGLQKYKNMYVCLELFTESTFKSPTVFIEVKVNNFLRLRQFIFI